MWRTHISQQGRLSLLVMPDEACIVDASRISVRTIHECALVCAETIALSSVYKCCLRSYKLVA